MDNRRDEFVAEAHAMFNDICILSDHELVRLIGYSEDIADYYWHCRKFDGSEVHSSAVGPCVSLRGNYRRYEYLDQYFAMNNCPPEPEFQTRIWSRADNERMYGERAVEYAIANGTGNAVAAAAIRKGEA